MNDTFNMNRFWLLVRRQWTENKKVYLLLWGVISLSLMVLAVFSEKNYLGMFYYLLFWGGGCVVTTTLFNRWSDFGRSSTYLLLPASSAEKFICGLFYGLILFIPAYCLNYFLVTYVVTYLVILLLPNNLEPFFSVIAGGIREIVSTPLRFYIFSFLTFLFAQSLCMITVIRFRKRQVLIFLLSLLVILVVYNLGMKILISTIAHIPGNNVTAPGTLPFFYPNFSVNISSGHQQVFEYFFFIKLIRNLNNLIWLVVFFIFYLTAWYKLKEREL